jgi:hypothetical protein
VSYGKATPYFPVLDLLKRYTQVEERDDARTIRAEVTGQVLTLDAALQETIPSLRTGSSMRSANHGVGKHRRSGGRGSSRWTYPYHAGCVCINPEGEGLSWDIGLKCPCLLAEIK